MMEVRKFRLYPTIEQQTIMESTLESCRKTWNFLLNQRKDRKEKNRKEQYHSIYEQKQKNLYLQKVYSHVLQNVADRLDKSFRSFFKGIARMPKFKKFGCYSSFTYPDAYNGSIKLGSSLRKTKLYLSNIGYVSVNVHREHPSGEIKRDAKGRIFEGLKRCTVKREADKWFAALEYQVPDVKPFYVQPLSPVGIDLATSHGERFVPPKPLQKNLKRLKHLQRSLSRKNKGSKNRQRARLRVSRLHWKIGMQRRDAWHKLTATLANKYDFFSIEDLQISNMLRNHTLARSISDAGWGMGMKMLQYKAERKSHRLVKVSPQYTSTVCSHCGLRKKSMPLSVRVFACERCNQETDRDTNASQVVEKIGVDYAKSKPVESGVQSFGTQPLKEAGILEAPSLQRGD